MAFGTPIGRVALEVKSIVNLSLNALGGWRLTLARKTANATQQRIDEAVDTYKMLTEVRYELAKEAYDFQDDDTKALLDRIVNRLRMGASGVITVRINPPSSASVPVKIDQEYLDYNLLYVATEILKDLAMFDIQVGTYQFPPSQCVSCGKELTKEQPKKKRKKAA